MFSLINIIINISLLAHVRTVNNLEIIREEASVSGATAALCSHLLDRYPSADAARAEVKNRLNDILRLLDLTLRHLGSCEAWTGSIKGNIKSYFPLFVILDFNISNPTALPDLACTLTASSTVQS